MTPLSHLPPASLDSVADKLSRMKDAVRSGEVVVERTDDGVALGPVDQILHVAKNTGTTAPSTHVALSMVETILGHYGVDEPALRGRAADNFDALFTDLSRAGLQLRSNAKSAAARLFGAGAQGADAVEAELGRLEADGISREAALAAAKTQLLWFHRYVPEDAERIAATLSPVLELDAVEVQRARVGRWLDNVNDYEPLSIERRDEVIDALLSGAITERELDAAMTDKYLLGLRNGRTPGELMDGLRWVPDAAVRSEEAKDAITKCNEGYADVFEHALDAARAGLSTFDQAIRRGESILARLQERQDRGLLHADTHLEIVTKMYGFIDRPELVNLSGALMERMRELRGW